MASLSEIARPTLHVCTNLKMGPQEPWDLQLEIINLELDLDQQLSLLFYILHVFQFSACLKFSISPLSCQSGKSFFFVTDARDK